MFAFGAALLGMPAAAQADALVGNIYVAQKGNYWSSLGAHELAQGFVTGDDTNAYTLESIEIDS